LAMQTINYNFDLDLTRYVTFDFDAIEFIIDSIGGVDIEVLSKEISSIPGVLQSGIQTLSGSQALSYMRIRYADSDYVRMSRQTTVMKAIFSKLKQTPYTKLLTLLNEALPFIETNLTKEEILNLGMEALKVDFNQIEQYQVPQNGYEDINHSVSYKGYSPLYVLESYETVVKQLHEGIYGDSEYEPSTTVLELEASIYDKFV
ncbi:MAG: LCP family protein, partial [Turicibacter sanguinis]